jgi:hypothetical protein|nr:hypothetical protein [Kofleriaceae bacterium]
MRAAAFLLLAASTAMAAPIAGTDHAPQRFVDETSTYVQVHARGDKGYGIHVEATVAGYASRSDTFRLDWKQSGKVVVSGKCNADKVGDTAVVRCDLDDTPTKVTGAVDGELIYIDDQDSKEYLVRDYKVTVAKYASAGAPVWQLVPDDLLAAGYVKHWAGKDSRGGRPNFVMWTATGGEGKDLILRCTVDGAKLDDLKASFSSAGKQSQTISADTHKGTTTVTYAWTHVAVVPANLMFGDKSAKEDSKRKGLVWLADHPGAWTCEVRAEAKVIRELRFKVDAHGMVVSDDYQEAADATAPLFPDVAAIDLRIPKDATFDLRVRPDAMRKSRGFGLPWPDHANVNTILSALPPARGLADPN